MNRLIAWLHRFSYEQEVAVVANRGGMRNNNGSFEPALISREGNSVR
jgi:hypothetical protein